MEIRTVLVIGAGTIGSQVAALFALRGFNARVHDTDTGALERSKGNFNALLERLVGNRDMLESEADDCRSRFSVFRTLREAAQDADFVSESIPEDLELKRQLFAKCRGVCKPEAIFTTNTSDLLPSLMADATGKPNKFASFHFHSPLRQGDIVDIMPHKGTDRETVEHLRSLANRLHLTPIVLEREHPGYVFNNLLNALNRAALDLVVQGVATPEKVDLAWTKVMCAPLGPFGILDRVGLDTAMRIAKLGAEHTGDEGLWRIVSYLNGYVEQGRLGVRSGKGFYDYEDSSDMDPAATLHKNP